MGSLYRKDINKYKNWFDESAKLLGVDVQYRYVIKRNTEIASGEAVYSELSKPIKQAVIVESGLPKIDSLKQLGWFTDTADNQLLVDFSVNTPNLQEGCRFTFESNENQGQKKEYSIIKLSSEQLYTSCIKCLCIPVLANETTVINNNIHYGQQEITADDENYSFINEQPNITVF